MTVRDATVGLLTNPSHLLIRQWNWKSAVFSSLIRGGMFFAANLTAGWRAATGAMLAEFGYRAIAAGFYGAMLQAYRKAEPEWAAAITVMLLMPAISHSIELAVHFLRGTPNLLTSLTVSVIFTMISTQFNLYAMRHGALIVGTGSQSTADDFRRMPRLVGGFLAAWPSAAFRKFQSRSSAVLTERSSDSVA